ncbi:hypothetical protein [Schlesneria paludicola]|uniref:hypothetical protein n=1 Tax=Schlesneria paludicola TaxID=360056 RepID=UPI0012F939B7|nr:hypothetical protein [Schlesneria paludicola]
MKPRKKKRASWSPSDIGFVAIAFVVVTSAALYAGSWAWKAVPTSDPDKALVEIWLKENLNDGKWEEVKWYPAQTPKGLFHLNLIHVVEGAEVAKELYEKGRGEDSKDAWQKIYDTVRESGLRTFCAMSFRVVSLNGEGKVLRRQVFEIVNGAARVCHSNDICELQSMPSTKGNTNPARGRYDGWRFFDEKDFDPFLVELPTDIEERFKAAMVWKEPIPTPVVQVAQPEPPRSPPVVVAATSPKAEPIVVERIPIKIREYLDRVREAKSAEIKVLEKRIASFESRLREVKVQQQASTRERIQQSEDAISQIKRSKGSASFPEKPEVGDIGSFLVVKVMDVIDEQTLQVRWFVNGKGRLPQVDAIIHPIDTTSINTGDESIGIDFYRVTATKEEPSEALTNLTSVGKKVEFVAEPTDQTEVEKWRSQHEKESNSKNKR